MFREARYLLADEPDLHDIALYHSVLAAIAAGNSQRGGISSYLGRKSGDLAHALTVLEDCGLLLREPDAFRDRRTQFRIAEPLLTFYQSVMRPVWADLEHSRQPERTWRRSQQRFQAQVLGPHFEQVCRYWSRHLAPEDIFAGYPNTVAAATVNDPTARRGHEIDLVVHGLEDDDSRPVLAIGEAKWGETMGTGHLDRLRHVRSILARQGRPGAATARLVCFSGQGFTAELAALGAEHEDIVLVAPDDLYADD